MFERAAQLFSTFRIELAHMCEEKDIEFVHSAEFGRVYLRCKQTHETRVVNVDTLRPVDTLSEAIRELIAHRNQLKAAYSEVRPHDDWWTGAE